MVEGGGPHPALNTTSEGVTLGGGGWEGGSEVKAVDEGAAFQMRMAEGRKEFRKWPV